MGIRKQGLREMSIFSIVYVDMCPSLEMDNGIPIKIYDYKLYRPIDNPYEVLDFHIGARSYAESNQAVAELSRELKLG